MTIQEYLNLSPEEQAIEAAKCFATKPWEHINLGVNAAGDTLEYPACKCQKCGKYYADDLEDDCSITDPMPFDWNTAKLTIR